MRNMGLRDLGLRDFDTQRNEPRGKPGATEKKPPQKKPRKPLPRMSTKRRKRIAEVTPFRKQYLADHPKCGVYPHMPSEEIHEITRGPNRDAALDEPAAILAVSRKGHEQIQHESLPMQLARKLKATPREFDLDVINRLLAPRDATEVPRRFEIEDVMEKLEVWPCVRQVMSKKK